MPKTCSTKCAHKLTAIKTDRNIVNKKISEGLKTSFLLNKKHKIIICKVCGKQYKNIRGTGTTSKCCCKDCSTFLRKNITTFDTIETKEKRHEAAIKGVLANNKRSKNEKLFCKLCEEHFNNVEHNVNLFNGWDADVIIHDIKYAVLWNGIWHYKKITKKHSIKQVQNRDEIKKKEIIKYGYTPYIIKDLGGYDENYVYEQFNIFLEKINADVV